ncbi:spirocyclase AveC family protein [Nocardia gamkensis]|uniref:spirocyclase AveC family protein n=1 Tax=Nocardia gamkensis TaxID=352869 RepID=UPI0036F12133
MKQSSADIDNLGRTQPPVGWEPNALRPRIVRWVLIVLGCAALVSAFVTSGRSVEGTRIARPPGSHVPERTEFLGISNWYFYFELLAIVGFIAMWSVSIYQTRKRGKPSPLLIMVATITVVSAWDPLVNWAAYTSYDPRMFHFRIDVPWINLEPTVQPWVAVWAYAGFFLIPAWFTLALYKRLAQRADPNAFLVRRPRLTLLAMSIPICIIFDAVAEALMVRAGIYSYAQVIPFGSIFVGEPWQFPLIWESVLFGLVLAPTAPMMWVNDQNQTWGETFALRFRLFRGRPNLGAFAMSVLVFSVLYVVVYFLCFAAIRVSGISTGVGTPWRFPETAVYDPQGYYEKAGNPGPYYQGTWGGWERRSASGGDGG